MDINTDQGPASASKGGVGSTAYVNFTFLVIYLAGLGAFGSFVNDMYLPSLPSMCKAFGCSVPTVQLGLTTGMIGLGMGQLVMGPVSARYGRKPVLVASICLFIAAAVVSIFSPTIGFFIGCRFFQGAGASGGYFLSRTIPADFYGGRTLAKTMAIIGAINGIAPASAPVLGGFISDTLTWKGVFWTLAGFGLMLLFFSHWLKESLPKAKRNGKSVWQDFDNYIKLARNSRFMTHVMLKGTALGFLFAYISSAPFIIQDHFGYSQVEFGVIMGANAVLVAAGAMVALKFKVLKKAAFVGALSLAAFTVAEACVLFFADSFWAYEIILLPICFSLGMIFTVSNSLAMNEGRTAAGASSAMLGVVGYIFGALVSPLVGLGNVLHSTAIAILALSASVLVCAILSRRIPADLDN